MGWKLAYRSSLLPLLISKKQEKHVHMMSLNCYFQNYRGRVGESAHDVALDPP